MKKVKNKEVDVEAELQWLDGRFIKSMGKIHYLCLIGRGFSHGYDIMQYMKEHYRLKLSAAAVYPLLQSLEEDGYISGEWVDGGYPRRKKYKLTPRGKTLLSSARRRIHFLVDEVVRKSQRPRRPDI